LLLIICILQASCSSDELLRFHVNAGELSYLDCRVSIDLSQLEADNYEALELFEETDGGNIEIPFQIEKSSANQHLWFQMEGEFLDGESRSYFLKSASDPDDKETFSIKILQNPDDLKIIDNEKSVLEYRTAEKMPPEGVDSLFRRSGYIHPLWSPGGEVLTRIQPPDHYHHYGIWNPWTLTHVNGRELDYWNLLKGEGTVRFGGLHYIEEGSLFCQLGVKQEHVDFGSGVAERVNMEEDLTFIYWGLDRGGSSYILDKRMSIRNILKDTILFDAYRYGGGIGFRATEKWNAENCTVLTSEGKTREEADGTEARWCIVEGESSVEEGRSGILFLSHPDNQAHPEPMRVWPLNINKGEMFFEFCPIRHEDWVIVPGVENILQYRMVVFDGTMTTEEAEMYWNGFASPPEIVVK
jgi:hypothetical protein